MQVYVESSRSASDLPIGTRLRDADGDVFMKVGPDSWAACEYTRSDRELENYVSDPVTIEHMPNGDN